MIWIVRILRQTFLLLVIFFSLAVIGKFVYVSTYVKHHNKEILMEVKAIDPVYFERFDAFIREVETTTPWRVYVTSAYRSAEEQAELHDDNPKNARSGKSKHQLGRAIDLNLFTDAKIWSSWVRKKTPKKIWESTTVPAIAQKHSLKWGGNFKTYYDPVHFELQ
jgi:hypothetical protein